MGKISDYATVTSINFGSGKTNTTTMKTKWNTESYGAKKNGDMWTIDMGEKFVLSKDEWLVLGSNFKKLDSDAAYNRTTKTLDLSFPSGATLTLNGYYWSSSLRDADFVWRPGFSAGFISSGGVGNDSYARLALTF